MKISRNALAALFLPILLLVSAISHADDLKNLKFRDIAPYLLHPAFAEGVQAQEIFEGLSGEKYNLEIGGRAISVTTVVKVGKGVACFATTNEGYTTYRCHRLQGEPALP